MCDLLYLYRQCYRLTSMQIHYTNTFFPGKSILTPKAQTLFILTQGVEQFLTEINQIHSVSKVGQSAFS